MTEGTITKTVWNKTIPQKIEWDINVPDTKRDILKLLSQTLTGHITDYRIQDNLFHANVELCANLLYLPEGSEEPVISALQSTETIPVKAEVPSNIAWDFVKPYLVVNGHSPVLINSRKAGIRGQMNLTICLLENAPVSCPNTNGKALEILWETVDSYSTPVVAEEQFPISLNFPLPAGKPPVLDILESSLAIRNPDLKAISNKAVAKGTLEAKILYVSTRSTIETAEFSSPFTEISDVGNLSEDYQITYEMKPVLQTVQILQNEENQPKNICFYGMVMLGITARKEEKISLICDAYSPKYQVKLLTKTAPFEVCKCLPEETISLKEMISLPDNQLEEILDICPIPKLSGAKTEEQKVHINGTIETRILYRNNTGIQCVTREIPWEATREIPEKSNWSDVSVTADLTHFSYHILNQNHVELRGTLSYGVCLQKQQEKQFAEAIMIEEDSPIICNRAPIVAYIIKPGDTLFSIAKKYATTVDRLKAVNDIENDRNLKVGSYLIIE